MKRLKYKEIYILHLISSLIFFCIFLCCHHSLELLAFKSLVGDAAADCFSVYKCKIRFTNGKLLSFFKEANGNNFMSRPIFLLYTCCSLSR